MKQYDDELTSMPNKTSMRMHLRRNDRYDYDYPNGHYTKAKELYHYIPKLLKKSIGKSFAKVFSKFCKKYPEYIGDINTRETFKKEFVEYNSRSYRGHIYADYCIDSQGRIQVVKPVYEKKSKRKVDFFVGTPVYYYTLNVQFLKSHPTLDSCLYRIIGRNLYDFCKNEPKIVERVYNKIMDLLHAKSLQITQAANDDGYRSYFYNDVFGEIFTKHTGTPTFKTDKHDSKYIQYREEQQDAKKREHREYLKEREEKYEEALRQLWEIKEKERKQNIIDRDRLGFDNNSFKKEKEG